MSVRHIRLRYKMVLALLKMGRAIQEMKRIRRKEKPADTSGGPS